jgi:transposase InsO family protein
MRLHANARSCPQSRLLLCSRVIDQGWTVAQAAAAAGVSERTGHKWLARYRSDGERGLIDRSSAPALVANATCERRVAVIAQLRALYMTAAEIAEVLGMAASTVSAILKRIGLGRRMMLEPSEPPNRYERRHPGELIHIDVKKLGRIGRAGHRVRGDRRSRSRGIGWEYVHVCVDDATRLAYVEVLEDERATTAAGFLRRAVAFYTARGVTVQRVMTDNGPAYRSTLHALTCRALGLRHVRTRPYRPRTNGKAERFIRTLVWGWAYGAVYRSSEERRSALEGWLDHYNQRRPHGSLGRQTPEERLAQLMNNVAGSYT